MRPGRGRREEVESEVGAEIRYHLERRAEALEAGGLDPDTARKRAVEEFGDVEAARAQLTRMDRRRARRDRWWGAILDAWADVRFAGRGLRRQPGLALALLATLGIGAGATTSIFSVTNAALLRPLPYKNADRLVHVTEVTASGDASRTSYPEFMDWRERSAVFAGLEAWDETNVIVASEAGGMMARGARVSAGFFSLLGVVPALGRAFRPDEEGPNADVVLVDNDYWRSVLNGDPSAIGQTVRIDARDYRIIGILPAGFRFAPAGDASFWFPLGGGDERRADRSARWLTLVGRLAEGETISAARASTARFTTVLASAYPATNAGRGARIVPLREQVSGPARPFVAILFAAAGLLLFIACANVASLLLARSLSRAPEFATRLALGASRGRLVRQLLVESLLVAAGGGALGVVVARAGTDVMIGALPGGILDAMPYLRDARPDATVFGFASGVALLAGLAFGLTPALAAFRAGASLLPVGGRGSAGARAMRLRDALVSAELALTVVLLVCAGLIARSLRTLAAEDPGFRSEGVLTVRVALAGPAYAGAEAQRRFFQLLMDRVRALPAVRSAGAVTDLPLNGGATLTYRIEGEPEPEPSNLPNAMRRGVAGDYFATMGIPILAGRALDARDDSTAPGALVISETMARAAFGGESGLERRLRIDGSPERLWTIVGVAADVRTGRLDATPPPTLYYSHRQVAENRLTLVVRSKAGTAALARLVEVEVRALDPSVTAYGVRSMHDVIADSPAVYERRLPLVVIAAFGAAALLLAVVGVYGVTSYVVARRSRELGIRSALGASAGRLMTEVLRHGARLAAAGVLAGVVIAFWFARLLSSLLYGVPATDAGTYAASAVALGIVGVLACVVPARRAARISASVLLRSD